VKVKCITNDLSVAPKELERVLGGAKGRDDRLLPEKTYVVYAITTYLGHTWYYIADESFSEYPIRHPSMFFKIADSRTSSHWRVDIQNGDLEIGFPEWLETPYFYDDLTNGDRATVEVFAKYKGLMDAEFPEPSEDEA
jgi:hypothetical protein